MLLEVAAPVILFALACKHEQDGKTVTVESKSVMVIQQTPPSEAKALEQAIYDDLRLVPEILDVRFERENGELLVWIDVRNPVKQARYRIYDKQAGIVQAFPELDINFSFVHVE